MTNQEYFIDDCKSCKYLFTSGYCLISDDDDDDDTENRCANCKNNDKHGRCSCLKRADKTLEHCPYWRDLDA